MYSVYTREWQEREIGGIIMSEWLVGIQIGRNEA
jgi:hypothetical protein